MATQKLEAFFEQLNASRDAPYDWSGNEPSEWAPWEFDWFGVPAQTQRVVRAIATTQYADGPVDEPGNDDLGAISSWYVWAALGIFPVTPGTADLALASPLFPVVDVTLPDGHHLVERVPGAAASRPYVRSLQVTGITRPAATGTACAGTTAPRRAGAGWELPWLPASALETGGTLRYSLSSTPDTAWGSAPADRPPSYGAGALPGVGATYPSGSTTVTVGTPSALLLSVDTLAPAASTVTWQVAPGTNGLTVSPSSGSLQPTTAASCGVPARAGVPLTITAAAPGTSQLRIELRSSSGVSLPPVVVDVDASP